MLKRLVILAIAAFMAFSVSGQPNKAANPNQQPGNPGQPVTAESTPEKQIETADDKRKADSNPPKWYAPLERPDWWLVIMGFGTLLVVGWQTKILGDSVAVAKNSAETTGKQVELYANAERARITIDITDFGRSFCIRGKNTGKAVAQILRASGYTLVLTCGESLPPVPPYLSEPDPLGDFVESVPPNEFIPPLDRKGYDFMVDLSDLDLCAAIRNKQKALWAYGRIIYMDGISSRRRETRFCYEATVDAGMETNIDMSGPGVYRLET